MIKISIIFYHNLIIWQYYSFLSLYKTCILITLQFCVFKPQQNFFDIFFSCLLYIMEHRQFKCLFILPIIKLGVITQKSYNTYSIFTCFVFSFKVFIIAKIPKRCRMNIIFSFSLVIISFIFGFFCNLFITI